MMVVGVENWTLGSDVDVGDIDPQAVADVQYLLEAEANDVEGRGISMWRSMLLRGNG